MTKTRQTLMFVLVLAALAFGFYFGRSTARPMSGESGAEGEEPGHAGDQHAADSSLLKLDPEGQARFNIKFAQVQTRTGQRMIEATGSVEANGTRLAHVRPLARGRINEVYVRLGDRVQAGQPLLSYDNVELGEVLGQYLAALAEIERSDAATELARAGLERARSLVELGAVAKAELQRRETEYRNSLAETERRKVEAAQVEEKLHRFGMTDPEIRKLSPSKGADYHRESSYSILRAPFAGVVTRFAAAPGESIDTESDLMTISDLSVVWVQADVYEKDIRFVREGSTAEVRVGAQPDRVFTGKVTHVGDVLDPGTRTAKVRVEVVNPERLLKVEMFANVRIPTPATQPVLMVPAEAVHRFEDHMVAFVKREDGFEKRPVEIGRRVGEWLEITEGLSEGEEVVTDGSFLLKSEAKRSELGHHEH
ncbi:MAG: efflux RND transporter periplasmic adaptor subunit [Acidobacteria bacterium]|nr:MAG: efflux RND transporter periplasmic adaptor subunit [Acidobacteriota bacterium]